MAYEFETENASTFKFTKSDSTRSNLTFNGVNSSIQSAQTIVNGLQRMLWIAGLQGEYNPEDGVRTVKQNVYDTE